MKIYNIYETTDTGVYCFRAGSYAVPTKVKDEAPHRHNFIEIVYVREGTSNHYVDGIEYKMKSGDMLFINYGCQHAFNVTSEKFFYYNVMFKPEFLGNELVNEKNAFESFLLTAYNEFSISDIRPTLMSFDSAERAEVESIVENMYLESYRRGKQYGAVLKGYMQVLFIKMLRKLSLPQDNNDPKWAQVISYIESNFQEKLSLAGLAQKCFYNPSYFSRSFKSKTGKTLVEYVNEIRIHAAAKRLAESDDSIHDICVECGFGNKNAFYRCFEQAYGIKPAEYRRKVKNRDKNVNG